MSSNMHLETILWLNRQIDDINAKATFIGEMLMAETDPTLIKKFDKKLIELEKELEGINCKIQLEREMLTEQL